MSRFPGVDFLDLDGLLSEEERLARDTVRAFVDDRVKPIIEECHREARFPRELVPELGALNLFGATIDDYGLPGLGNVAYGLIMQELERGDSGLRSFVSVQSALVMYPIYTFGSQAQKDRWIPALASGEAIGCFGLTEPDFGSNPSGMRTTARRDGDSWVLNGAKQWITSGTLADVAVVWARTEEGIRGFLVEKGTPGYTSSDQHGKFSLRASVTSELGRANIPAYSAAKGGVRMMTRSLSTEWAKHGVTVNAIGPGYVLTEMNTPLVEDKDFNAWVCARTPAGRWASPDEIAGAAVFLASPAASYVSGQILYVDGGFTAAM